MKNKISFLVTALIGVPLVLGALLFGALRLQPAKTWRALMPSQMFSHPQMGLQLLVLSRNDTRDWESLYESTYFYREGRWSWLVLKEGLKPRIRSGPGAKGLAVAVDPSGKFFEYEGAPQAEDDNQGNLVFHHIPKLPDLHQKHLGSGLILVEDEEVWKSMVGRIPALARREYVTFAQAFERGDANLSSKYGTQLKAPFIPRVALFLSFFIALALLIWTSAPLETAGKLAATFFSIPVGCVLLLTAFQIGSFLSPRLYPIMPLLLWAVTALLLSRKLLQARERWQRLIPMSELRTWIRENRKLILVLGLPLAMGALYTASLTYKSDLTWGDACAFTFASAAIYDTGEWNLATMSSYPLLSNFLTYPPSIGVLMSYILWAVGPSKDAIYFPGRETGSVWLLYGALLNLLHFALIGASYFTLQRRFRQKGLLFVGILVFLCFFVPSTSGTVHASEAVLWPLAAFAMIGCLLFQYYPGAAPLLIAVTTALGLPYVKKEGMFELILLVAPWLALAAFAARQWIGRNRKTVLIGAATAAFLLIPLALLQKQRAALGIVGTDFHPIQLATLQNYLPNLREVLTYTTKLLLARNDVHYVDHPIPFLLMVVILFAVAQLLQFRWRRFIIPACVAIYCFAFPTIYIFSTWNPIWLHIFQSWGRIVLPAYTALALWSAEAIADLTQRETR